MRLDVGCSTGFLILAWAAVLNGCGGGPHLEVPTPGEENYTALRPVAVHAMTANNLVVIGNIERADGTPEGLILQSESGGTTWQRRAVEVHDLRRVSFHSVFFGDRVRGWVAGVRVDSQGRTRPVVFRTEDGGNHWREAFLPQDPMMVATEVHDLLFTSDRDGTVGVSFTDPASGLEKESFFVTQDSGRSWIASSWRQDPKQPVYDQTQSFIDGKLGYRLSRSPHPGITVVETTGSGGQDWMPVSEISLALLSTYY